MGWRAIYKDGTIKNEDDLNEEGTQKWGRPVDDGEAGKLLVIAQESNGHNVAVDLVHGYIVIDYTQLSVQNGSLELAGPFPPIWLCDETNIVGELAHHEERFYDARDEDNRRILQDGRFVKVKDDIYTPVIWRPIWFTRLTNGTPTYVIGAQTTLPKEQGGKNYKRMVNIFEGGRIGIT